MTRLMLALALVVMSRPAGAQAIEDSPPVLPTLNVTVDVRAPARPTLLLPLYSSFATLAAGDGYLTWRVLQQGGIEQNPVAAPLATNAYAWTTFKVATSAALILAIERLRREHPRAAVWTMVLANASMTWVVWHNTRVLGALR